MTHYVRLAGGGVALMLVLAGWWRLTSTTSTQARGQRTRWAVRVMPPREKAASAAVNAAEVVGRVSGATCDRDTACNGPHETCNFANKTCIPVHGGGGDAGGAGAEGDWCFLPCQQEVAMHEAHLNGRRITVLESRPAVHGCTIIYRVDGKADVVTREDYGARSLGILKQTEALGGGARHAGHCRPLQRESGVLEDVDVFLGTQGTGHTTPGAKYPFGMLYMAPVNSYSANQWWAYSSGYQHDATRFAGIAHTAMTGAGMRGLLNVVISPFPTQRGGRMDKATEIASPGYYSVTVDNISIAVAAGNRYGIHRYKWKSGRLDRGGNSLFFKRNCRLTSFSPTTFGGACDEEITMSVFAKFHVYFYATTSVACNMKGSAELVCDSNDVELRIAISFVDQTGARHNYDAEEKDWEHLRASTRDEWSRLLGRIQVAGWRGQEQRRTFRSAMYHALVSPYARSDVDGRVRGPGGKVHAVNFTYYSFLSTWDTYRAWSTLVRIISPQVLTDIAETCVYHYQVSGMMPRWTIASREASLMPGVHGATLSYQAWRWGLTDDDLTRRIYDAMVATLSGGAKYKGGHLKAFLDHDGFVPCDLFPEQVVSEALEFGFQFHCLAELAAHLGDSREDRWRGLARAYRQHYDNETSMLVGVKNNHRGYCRATSITDVDGSHHLYTEGNAITWFFHVMHDFEGLQRLVGPAKLRENLDTLFTVDAGKVLRADFTGLIGAYAHGNEPSHHAPFWFKLAGDAAATDRIVEQILTTLYTDQPDGLPGNDDAGQLSAWYVLATLGVYPIDPSSATLATHTPLVGHAYIANSDGSATRVRAWAS